MQDGIQDSLSVQTHSTERLSEFQVFVSRHTFQSWGPGRDWLPRPLNKYLWGILGNDKS